MVVVGVAIALADRRPHEVPRTAPAKVSVFTRAARADLYGDAINEELLMRPGDRFVTGLVGLRRPAASTGSSTAPARAFGGHVRHASAGCRPASSAPTPCRSSAAPCVVVLALLAVNLA